MRMMTIIGIALLVAGLAALAWPSITYTTRDKVLDVGPVEVTTEDRDRIAFPPILGVGAAVAGLTLIALGSRKATA